MPLDRNKRKNAAALACMLGLALVASPVSALAEGVGGAGGGDTPSVAVAASEAVPSTSGLGQDGAEGTSPESSSQGVAPSGGYGAHDHPSANVESQAPAMATPPQPSAAGNPDSPSDEGATPEAAQERRDDSGSAAPSAGATRGGGEKEPSAHGTPDAMGDAASGAPDTQAEASSGAAASAAPGVPTATAVPAAPAVPADERRGPDAPAVGSGAKEELARVRVWRLYNRWTGEHLYTTDEREYNSLPAYGWVQEESAWMSPATSESVTYRLYNPYSGDHLYTTDRGEYDGLGATGWKQEGVCWYGSASDGTRVYRLFNPFAVTGTHLYTTSAGERLGTTGDGWRYEGIAWYGLDLGPLAPEALQSGWVSSGNERFYGKEDGAWATGWQTVDGARRHFDERGRVSHGVDDVDGTLYDFDSNGVPQTGWQNLSRHWYFFDSSTGALRKDGWLDYAGSTYYLDTDSGAMVTGWRKVDGVWRWFDGSGACDKVGYQVRWGSLRVSNRTVVLPSYTRGSWWSYVKPNRISASATRSQIIEAFIASAYDYWGSRWVDNHASYPGDEIDCSGLVMEALYSCGMSLDGIGGRDFNPYSKYYWNHHFANTWRQRQVFQPIGVNDVERGDIIYYNGHVAIYLGGGLIIESTPYYNVRVSSMYSYRILGAARPFTK